MTTGRQESADVESQKANKKARHTSMLDSINSPVFSADTTALSNIISYFVNQNFLSCCRCSNVYCSACSLQPALLLLSVCSHRVGCLSDHTVAECLTLIGIASVSERL